MIENMFQKFLGFKLKKVVELREIFVNQRKEFAHYFDKRHK